MIFSLSRQEILDLEGSLKKEYLLTNGRGGYCSSTLLDCHTRKYHGLLITSIEEYDKRFVMLSKLEPVVGIKGKFFRLSTNKFPFVYEPQGHKYIDSITWDLFPVTIYKIGEDTEIKKSILMQYDEDSVLIRFDVTRSSHKILLKITPLLAYRDIHSLSTENIFLRPRTFPEKNGFKIEPYEGMPPLFIQLSHKNDFYASPVWFKNFEYLKERNRGYPYQEDLFSPGVFEINLKENDTVIVRASLNSATPSKFLDLWDKEIERIKKDSESYKSLPEPLNTLKTSASSYLIFTDNPQKTGIVAGFHWFDEWTRDTMISLCGLTLDCNKKDIAFNILKRYSNMIKNSILPNIIFAKKDHLWNSADASFLYIRAIQQYLKRTGEKEIIKKIFLPYVKEILDSIIDGKNPLLFMKEDGLVYCGNFNTQLTWMDAMVNGIPVTPRNGAAVEINALWYNSLKFYLSLEEDQRFLEVTKVFEDNFLKAFWCEETSSLVDVYRTPSDRDISIRPNQLFAIGLPYSAVSSDKSYKILETVKQHLVTPFGLRTLSPADPNYRNYYKGSPEERDKSYHQGMVWPWLIGILIDSIVSLEGKKKARKYLENTFKPLFTEHLCSACIGHISEIFLPDPPQTPKGAVAQAWSIAELIRAFTETETKGKE